MELKFPSEKSLSDKSRPKSIVEFGLESDSFI